MDPVTHALLGGLAARVKRQQPHRKDGLSTAARTAAIVTAAAFPDIDYCLFWWDPYRFITDWHRGITHSLLMIPLWSILLGILFALAARKIDQWKVFSRWAAFGLLCHIVADVPTIYGTQVFTPISDYRVALNLTFDFDPWIGLITAMSLIVSLHYQGLARWGIVLLLVYLTMQFFLQRSALVVAKQYQPDEMRLDTKIYALPQPISPFHWKLVVEGDDYYQIAYLNFLNTKGQQNTDNGASILSMLSAYQSRYSLVWRRLSRFGEIHSDRKIAMQIWQHDSLAEFRRFAELPVAYRIDRDNSGVCVWFTDLRHILPTWLPPFRYGMCRSVSQNKWQLYRLKRYTENARQLIF